MAKKGKKFQACAEKITQETYTIAEACSVIKDLAPAKFDETVEIHVNLNIDPKHADQQLRTSVVLPHGTGKTKRVVAFVGDEHIAEAKAAGAIEAGNEELFARVADGWTDFDVAVAHPSMMKHLGKLGKILGTKGLMPNPKTGTVTPEIAKTVKEMIGGKVELRADAKGIVHTVTGKVSFDSAKIEENMQAVLKCIKDNKPSGAKGKFFSSISIASTMGPGIAVNVDEVN